MKRLLALSWCMPPIVMPRGIQVSRLLAALAEFDWQSDVVCVDPASLRAGSTILDESLNRPAGGNVKRFPVPSLEDWMPVRVLNRLFPDLVYLPDGKWVWKNAAFRKLDALASAQTYDAFISFAQPWTDHLSGLQLKIQTGLPWIAHFSDPWADSPFVQRSTRVIQHRRIMEEAVIQNADAVVFVSEQTADLVMKKYPEDWRRKVHVIPHGFEPETSAAAAEGQPGSPVEFVYTGNFYGPRTPDTLLEAASRLAANPDCAGHFLIRFVGPIAPEYPGKIKSMGLETWVKFEGPVTFSASQEYCRQADVLLVIDAPSDTPSVFLPSKLVDYLAFNKPVLGITPLQGASADLISRLGCPVIDPRDVEGITSALAGYVTARRKGPLPLPENFPQTASGYTINHAAGSLNNLLTSLSAGE